MEYTEELNKENYQIFNSVSDYIDYNPMNLKKVNKIKYELSIQKENEIISLLGIDDVSSLFLSAFLLILQKYGRQDSILIGVKNKNEIIPFGVVGETNEVFSNYIKKIDNLFKKTKKINDDINFADYLNAEYNSVVFSYNNKEYEHNVRKNILYLNIVCLKNNFKIELYFDSDYYEYENMNYFLKHYINILNKIETINNLKLKDIELTDENEKEILLNKFNNDYIDMSQNKTAIDFIEENAKVIGDKVAVIYSEDKITYKELNDRSNALAYELKSQGVSEGDYVVIIPERSIEMIIGILAILKCGAIYVPVDPSYPNERIKYIVETCNPKIILTIGKKISFKNNKSLNIKDRNYDKTNKKNPIRTQEKDSIAYCIFTSGTTGRPKGVLLNHKGLINLVLNYKEIYGISENDVLLQFASIAFDQSVWDIFTILVLGGTLCLMSKELINEPRLLEIYMEKNKVSVIALTPAYIKLLNPKNLPTLKVIESGSAAVDYEDIKRWTSGRRVFNTYGPTEATVNTLTYEIKDIDNRVLPIGKPIKNSKVFILNNNNNLCGIGEPGELCIAGYGVGNGYLNLEDKTNEAFVKCPFLESKMYRTGDVVKYRADGEIIYIGRLDDQIKIRGFRIELGEIENCLKEIPNIKDVVLVINKKDGENEIEAFFTSDKEIEINYIKKKLSEKLAYYMIPSYIYQVEKIPLTINGKVDKIKLKEMKKSRVSNLVLPVGEFENVALDIFKNILKDENICVVDDFYEIGGSSIKAIMIIAELREKGYNYNVCDLLKAKTIRKLGKIKESLCINKNYIKLENEKYKKIIKKLEVELKSKATTISYLTPTQKYMLEAYRMKIVGDNFLQYYYTCPNDIDVQNLKKSIELLSYKNEALTTVIIDDIVCPVQIRFEHRNIEFEYIENLDQENLDEICKKDVFRGFDIEKDTMIRFKLFKMKNNCYKLLCSLSHMIVDGWSVELIIQDLSNIYMQLQARNLDYNSLKEKNVSEKDSKLEDSFAFITSQSHNLSSGYWNDYFKILPEARTIPYDKDILSNNKENWSVVDWIDEELAQSIKKYCKKMKISENTIFELVYAYLIAISNNKKSSFFYKVISGRDIPVVDVDKIVGMFINIIPQKIEFSNNISDDILKLNNILLSNSTYDKFDFYHNKVNDKILMNEGNTIFVFSNYYELTQSIFEYEHDRDQDEVDMSFFVDAMKDKYHIIITGQKRLYKEETLKKVCHLYKKLLKKICYGESLDDLYF